MRITAALFSTLGASLVLGCGGVKHRPAVLAMPSDESVTSGPADDPAALEPAEIRLSINGRVRERCPIYDRALGEVSIEALSADGARTLATTRSRPDGAFTLELSGRAHTAPPWLVVGPARQVLPAWDAEGFRVEAWLPCDYAGAGAQAQATMIIWSDAPQRPPPRDPAQRPNVRSDRLLPTVDGTAR